jgi:Uma2 family endonuclease
MTIILDLTNKSDKSISQIMTLEEFFNYDDGTDAMYELEDGVLIEMTAESEINRRITSFLFICFFQQGIPAYRLSMKTEIVTTGSRLRVPDLVVLSEELATAMSGSKRSTVMPDMPPPLLLVEVVSPNQGSRDYRYKRSEYAARGIIEYWIIDPILKKVTVLEWIDGFYEEKVYTEGSSVASVVFANLNLSATQILQGF